MRPTKLNEQMQTKILELIRAGNYIETACAVVGINKTTLYEWMKRGAREQERVEKNPKAKIKKTEEQFVEFSNAIKKAQAEAEARDVMIIANASKHDWKASAWRLERKYADRWARKERMDMDIKSQHTDKKEVHIHQQLEDDPESKELLKQLFRRQMTLETSNEND